MKIPLLLCSLILGGCMMVAAQQYPSSSQAPSTGTPPTFPQSQTPDTSNPGTMPPDTTAPVPNQQTTDQNSSAKSSAKTAHNGSIQGCLGQSGSNYILTDQSGNTYQLQGDTSKLASHIGQEVSIKGNISRSAAASSSTPSSQSESSSSGISASSQAATSGMSGSSSASSGSSVTVKSVKKIADSCGAGPAPRY